MVTDNAPCAQNVSKNAFPLFSQNKSAQLRILSVGSRIDRVNFPERFSQERSDGILRDRELYDLK